MTNDDLERVAAEYVLGVTRGEERVRMAVRIEADSELRARVAYWQARMAERAAGGGTAPAEPVATDPSGMLTLRNAAGEWTDLAPGVKAKILRDNWVLMRRSMLVRMVPGAVFAPHDHDLGDEECLVLEGDLAFGDLKLQAGDFHLAGRGTVHCAATTLRGCLLHISTGF